MSHVAELHPVLWENPSEDFAQKAVSIRTPRFVYEANLANGQYWQRTASGKTWRLYGIVPSVTLVDGTTVNLEKTGLYHLIKEVSASRVSWIIPCTDAYLESYQKGYHEARLPHTEHSV